MRALPSTFLVLACTEAPPEGTKPPASPPENATIEESAGDSEDQVRFQIKVAPNNQPGQEAYRCFRLDAARLRGLPVRSVRWTPPQGNVIVHHATLFASTNQGALGGMNCNDNEGSSAVLHVYTPGAVPLSLPPGVAMALPDDTHRLILEIHALRQEAGEAEPLQLEIELEQAPLHLATWMDIRAWVPDIQPHSAVESTARCQMSEPIRLVSTWPHMHFTGSHFLGQIVRASGEKEELIRVDSWDFSHQPLYPRDVALAPGDAIQTTCAWHNATDQVVRAGVLSSEEMCNQGVIVWPRENARCKWIKGP